MGECEGLLIPDMSFTQKDVSISLSYLSIINSTNFEEHKQNFGASTTFPMADVLLKGSANYDEFSQKRSELFKLYQFDYGFQDLSTYYQRSLPENRAQAYLDCIHSTGFRAAIGRADAEFVYVVVEWIPTPLEPEIIPFDITFVDGGKLQSRMPKKLKRNSQGIIVFMRTPDQDFRFVANVASQATEIFVPKYREPRPALTLRLMEPLNVRSNAWVPMVINATDPTIVRVTGKWFNHIWDSLITAAQGFRLKIQKADGTISEIDNDMLPKWIETGGSAWVQCADPELSDNDTFWEDPQWATKFKDIYDHGPVRYYVWS